MISRWNRRAAILTALIAVSALTIGFVRALRESGEAFRPHNESELTLIIDAGHGGYDGGAVSPDGLIESYVNLAIAERVDELAAFFGVRTLMTRQSQNLEYSETGISLRQRKTEDQHNRLELILETPNAVFLSIHQNKYTSPRPYGAQALYAGTEGSEEFGDNLQELFKEYLLPGNVRKAERIRRTIFLMNNIECPAVLVECGFLSNPEEERLLRTDSYRTKVAAVITAGFLQSRGELEAVYEPNPLHYKGEI